jgi:hypothetical protein
VGPRCALSSSVDQGGLWRLQLRQLSHATRSSEKEVSVVSVVPDPNCMTVSDGKVRAIWQAGLICRYKQDTVMRHACVRKDM